MNFYESVEIRVGNLNISIIDIIKIYYEHPNKLLSFKTINAWGTGVSRQILNYAFTDAIDKGIFIKKGLFFDVTGNLPDTPSEPSIIQIEKFYFSIGRFLVDMIRIGCKIDLHFDPKLIAVILGLDNLSNNDADYLMKVMDPQLHHDTSKINKNDYYDLTLEWHNKFDHYRHLLKQTDNNYYKQLATNALAQPILKFYSNSILTAKKLDRDFSGPYIISPDDLLSCFVYGKDINDDHKKNIEYIIKKLDSDKLKMLLKQLTNSTSVGDKIRVSIIDDKNDNNYSISTCFRTFELKNEVMSDINLLEKLFKNLTVPDLFIKDADENVNNQFIDIHSIFRHVLECSNMIVVSFNL